MENLYNIWTKSQEFWLEYDFGFQYPLYINFSLKFV